MDVVRLSHPTARLTERRRARSIAALLTAVWVLTLGGCTTERDPAGGAGTADAERGSGSYGESIRRPGSGEFAFQPLAPPDADPLTVRYVAPKGGASTADILIVLHGTGRNGEGYRDAWVPLVRDRNVLVLVPEFPEEDFPGSSYNTGNMLDEDEDPLPPKRWAFPVIEQLFDDVVADVDSDATDYALFGHSAGAQFVHRFVEFGKPRKLRVAVAANAGWYTTLDDSVDFPYGLGDSPSSESRMAPALATDLVLLLGADDVDPEDDSLRRNEESDAQGVNRLQRGMHFFLTSREMAAERSLPFAWGMTVVPGVAHSHPDMAAAAAPILLGPEGG